MACLNYAHQIKNQLHSMEIYICIERRVSHITDLMHIDNFIFIEKSKNMVIQLNKMFPLAKYQWHTAYHSVCSFCVARST